MAKPRRHSLRISVIARLALRKMFRWRTTTPSNFSRVDMRLDLPPTATRADVMKAIDGHVTGPRFDRGSLQPLGFLVLIELWERNRGRFSI